jgi:hypothetical protein
MAATTHRIGLPGGEHLVLDWTPPAPGGTAAALFVHGLGSHRRGDKALHFAERFAALGWGFLALDLRGHGESGGGMRGLSLSRCLEDVSAALAWLPRPAAPRLLIGSSMGAAVVAWHRLLHPLPDGLSAFIAPSLAFPQRWAEELPPGELAAWQRAGVRRFRSEWIDLEIGWGLMEDARRYDAARLAREYATPTLILHGMQDVAVDWRASVRFLETCPCAELQLLLIKSGDHRLTEQRAYLFDALVAWLRERGVLT